MNYHAKNWILTKVIIWTVSYSCLMNGCGAQSSTYIDKLYYGCSDGRSEIGRCLKDPCDSGLVCKDYPAAKCYTNLCKKCTAKWWLNDNPVECRNVERVEEVPEPLPRSAARKFVPKTASQFQPRPSPKAVLVSNKVRRIAPSKIKTFKINPVPRGETAPPTYGNFEGVEQQEDGIDYQGSKLYFGCTEEGVVDYCLQDPCIKEVSPCKNYPEAECHANVCQTCNAKWWIGNELIQDCFTEVPLLLGKERPRLTFSTPVGLNDWQLYHGCNGVEEVVDCPSWEWNKLCPSLTAQEIVIRKEMEDKGAIYENSGCPNYPSAICHPNACSQCSVKYWFWGNPVDCDEPFGEFKARKTFGGLNDTYCQDGYTCQCAQGRDPVFCYYDPCAVSTCYSHPGAECRSNNCDGCNAQFYVGGKRVFC